MLLSNQKSLKRLPVPDLKATVRKLLKTLEPLCETVEDSRRVSSLAR